MSARLLVLAALFAGCSPAPDASSSSDGASRVSLTAADAGGPQTLAVGQRITVTLASNRTTGYRWALADSANGTLARDGDPTYVQDPSPASDPPVVGRGGAETWAFRTARAGSGTLSLVYRRPFDSDGTAPAETFSVPIAVR